MENVEKTNAIDPNENNKAKSIVGMVMTLVALILSWMGLVGGFPGFLSIVVSIIGILIAKKEPYKKIAKYCGIAGIAVSVVCTVIGFFLIAYGIISLFN
ncbi:MAG: hypothetical protein IJO64_03620 [Clostridia bacterium]|nr:hypothetical protein [Clostridia bacterium]